MFSVTLALLTGLLAFQRRAPFDTKLIAFPSDRDYPDKSRSSLYVMSTDGSFVTLIPDGAFQNPSFYHISYDRHPDEHLDRCQNYEYVGTLEESPNGRGWLEDSGEDWKLIRVPTGSPNGWKLFWVEDGTIKNITNHPVMMNLSPG